MSGTAGPDAVDGPAVAPVEEAGGADGADDARSHPEREPAVPGEGADLGPDPGTATAGRRRDAGGAGARWSVRTRLAGQAVAVTGVAAIVASLLAAGSGLKRPELLSSWQTLRPSELAADPFGSVWYLHVQPPLHNLVVGSVLRWSPFPEMGSLFALYALALVLIAGLLVDLLGRWGVHPVAAGGITVLALSNPNLLSTIGVASYEVPVTALLVACVWAFSRYLERPGPATLLVLAGLLTAIALTRSLFHPAWVLAVLLLAVLARPVRWRHVGAAVAIPVVLVGGWMVKNQVLFGEATTSSWLGFNLQRGVVATFEAEETYFDADTGGRVSMLALEYPWGDLDTYEEFVGDCRPDHDHPVVADPVKARVGMIEVANFNHECYLPLYRQAQDDALALIRLHPMRYLSTRRQVLASSFAMAQVGFEDPVVSPAGTRQPSRTWMDEAGDVWLLPIDSHISMADWNLPLLGDAADVLSYRFSVTLLVAALAVLVLGALAAWRLKRAGWRDRATTWDPLELTWVVVAATGVLVIVVGDLIEFGENGRFRAMLDPLLIALPLGLVARAVQRRLDERRATPA